MQTQHYPANIKDPQAISRLLQEKRLSHLIKKAKQLKNIAELLQQIMPKELSPHCQLLNFRADTLTLRVDSAAIATRLRFASDELMQSLRFHDALQHIKQIHWVIKPPSRIHQPPHRGAGPKLSHNASQLLKETACHVSNVRLQASLQRLSLSTIKGVHDC